MVVEKRTAGHDGQFGAAKPQEAYHAPRNGDLITEGRACQL
jgi:hypothetical protein